MAPITSSSARGMPGASVSEVSAAAFRGGVRAAVSEWIRRGTA